MKKITFLLTGFVAVGFLAFAGCDGETDTNPTTSSTVTSTTSGMPGSTSSSTSGGGGAGGGSADACGPYCTAIMANCKDMNAQYSDMASCMGSCKALPADGMEGATSGNTIQCRTYHAGMPAMTDPAMHCKHAGPGGDGACGMNCEGFCAMATETCATEWPAMAACMTACDGFNKMPPYDASVAAGDSFACRLYHLTVATTAPGTHCAHTVAMPKAGDPCAP